METFTALLKQIGQIFTWWFCVAPWEQAIRVRLGKRLRRLDAGVYLRVPFVDRVYVQSVRRRVTHLNMQTVQTQDGHLLTVAGSLSFAVADIEKLYQTLHHAQDTLMQLAAVAISESAGTHDLSMLTPATLSTLATARLDFERFGLSAATLSITDFARIRTYRLLMDQKWGAYGETLNTESAQP